MLVMSSSQCACVVVWVDNRQVEAGRFALTSAVEMTNGKEELTAHRSAGFECLACRVDGRQPEMAVFSPINLETMKSFS
jgi:hypothetical protein